MAKLIISDFSGGISEKNRNIPTNQFSEGAGVDIYTDDGYIKPNLALSEVQTSAGSVIRDTPINMVVDNKNGKAYILAINGDLYQITNLTTNAFNSNFDGASHYYKAITNFSITITNQYDLIVFNSKLCFSYNISNNAYVGTYDLTSAFDLTDMDLGNAATNYSAPHPMIEWNGILWIGNGRYLAKSTDAAAVDNDFFDLGEGWEITALFPADNFIGICAWKSNSSGNIINNAECRIFFYDGTSAAYTYFIPVSDNIITGALNIGGLSFINSFGKHNHTGTISIVNGGKLSPIRRLKFFVNNTFTQFSSNKFYQMSVMDGKLMICNTFENGTSTNGKIFSINTESPFQFSFPYSIASGANVRVYFIKPIRGDKAYIGWTTNAGVGTLSLLDLTVTSYNTATYKAGYTDFGQRVRINYVKFYFKPLVSGDAITPTLEADYGTSWTLTDPNGNATIGYTIDGAITSKRFNIKRDCHAIRPAISFTTGNVNISKIVIDFINIEDT